MNVLSDELACGMPFRWLLVLRFPRRMVVPLLDRVFARLFDLVRQLFDVGDQVASLSERPSVGIRTPPYRSARSMATRSFERRTAEGSRM